MTPIVNISGQAEPNSIKVRIFNIKTGAITIIGVQIDVDDNHWRCRARGRSRRYAASRSRCQSYGTKMTVLPTSRRTRLRYAFHIKVTARTDNGISHLL